MTSWRGVRKRPEGVGAGFTGTLLAHGLALAFFLFCGHFALRLAQHAGVMFGMLEEVFGCHAVIRQLRIAGERQVLVDDLLRRAADLALGAGRVEDPVDDIAERALPVRFRTRTVLG